jgi:hypothetical protein
MGSLQACVLYAVPAPVPGTMPRWRRPPGEDDCRGPVPRLHQDIFGAAAARPVPRTLAPDRQPADPPPRGLQLRRRDADRRHHPQTVPAALRRLRQPVAVRDLPRQPRRLRRIGLLHRPPCRHLPRRPRHRLRPLPQRPHRLDPTPDELRAETTKVAERGVRTGRSTRPWPPWRASGPGRFRSPAFGGFSLAPHGGASGMGRCPMGAWPRSRSGICRLRCCCALRVRSPRGGGRPGPVRWDPRGSRCRAGTPR